MADGTSDAGRLQERLARWADLVGEAGHDGWLIADFRWNNPLFARFLDLHEGILTRRAFLWLPAPGRGEPHVLASRIDGHSVAHLDCPLTLYAGYDEMSAALQRLLPTGGRVAMEYVAQGLLPTVSRVDAGLVELIRSFGVTVVSSGALIAMLDRWDERQRRLHERAARGVDAARRAALARCAELLGRGDPVTEGALVSLIRAHFAEAGLSVGDGGPDVAVDAHAADPHYGTGDGPGAAVTRDAVLLIDLWAQVRDEANAPFADSTWMAYTGPTPPAELTSVFTAVRDARDAALQAIAAASWAGTPIAGRAVDVVARAAIPADLAGYLVHRTGHSLGSDHVHGMGTNLDSVEFPDDRPLLDGSGFTVEPGLYLPGRFGVRMEVSVILGPDGPLVTTESQTDLTLV